MGTPSSTPAQPGSPESRPVPRLRTMPIAVAATATVAALDTAGKTHRLPAGHRPLGIAVF
ncbi:hypothetical protein [Streptomyces chryseus]|uniref:Uncharacterized protein n=1 Tax=Streptomyces chryseus TaxID=68186 RepID=A0ABQ3DKX8_9ACTN|nr:hypothetical protein [Streptomyces chryseus]GGX25407.1 hypothetical protein GCM10010353_45460 [Streptomyces chryseus]GHB05128.1 hypothetical protein GCM10010346_30150 [Streptomyces chryseus]